MTNDLKTPDPLPDTIRAGAREASAAWIVDRSLATLVGGWAISRGVTEIVAGLTLPQVGKQADRLVA